MTNSNDDLEFGRIYLITSPPDHSCDNCGTVFQEKFLARYDGDFNGAHCFAILFPWSCLGCWLPVEAIKVIPIMEVTQQFKDIKND